MRNISINAVDTRVASQNRSETDTQIIADTWQFYVDATMTISLIVPPNGGDFRAFPCGPDAIGRLLFEVVGLEDNLTTAVDFYSRFRAQENIQNALFQRRSSDGVVRTVLINGLPLFNSAGACEGYRCTVSNLTPAMGMVNDIHKDQAA